MMKMKIQWTPWLVTMDRRLEVFSAFVFIWIVLFAELTTVTIIGWILVGCCFASPRKLITAHEIQKTTIVNVISM